MTLGWASYERLGQEMCSNYSVTLRFDGYSASNPKQPTSIAEEEKLQTGSTSPAPVSLSQS